MRSRLYILIIVMGLSVFTYNSDSQNGAGIGAYTSTPSEMNLDKPLNKFPKKSSIYCNSAGKSIAHGWINEVVVGQYEFVSGSNSGYADLSGREFDIQCGSFNAFDIKSGQSNSALKHNWRLWIDYNQDGLFDNDEQVLSNYSVHMKGLVYIPSRSKVTYRTGMRIAMNKDEIPNSCGQFENGEVEDYTVVLNVSNNGLSEEALSSTSDFTQKISKHRVNVYPNPANLNSPIWLDLESKKDEEINISVFSIDGRLVKTGTKSVKTGNNLLNVEGMITENGVYLLKMKTEARSFIKKITVIE